MMETQQVVTGDAASLRKHAVAAAGMVLYCLGLLAPCNCIAVHIGLPLRLGWPGAVSLVSLAAAFVDGLDLLGHDRGR